MENKNGFCYNYSAKDAEEIRKIRNKYINNQKELSVLEQIRELDRKAEKPGMIIAMTLGIIGTLILGIGMCCVMIWADKLFTIGVVIGIMGIIIMGISYPVYIRITKIKRREIAPDILNLTESISNM